MADVHHESKAALLDAALAVFRVKGYAATRVEALKLFLSDLKTKKFTEANLGAGLRVRRKGGAGHARRGMPWRAPARCRLTRAR